MTGVDRPERSDQTNVATSAEARSSASLHGDANPRDLDLFPSDVGTERAAFEMVVTSRLPWLRRTAHGLCADHQLAEDLTQIALAKLFVAWPLRRTQSVDSWLRTTLVRSFIDERRRPSSRRELVMNPLPDMPALPGPEPFDDHIARGLAGLPAPQRACLTLRFLEDCSVEQTAIRLGYPASTVRSHTARGLAALRSTHFRQSPSTT